MITNEDLLDELRAMSKELNLYKTGKEKPMNAETELLPCPFCGESMVITTGEYDIDPGCNYVRHESHYNRENRVRECPIWTFRLPIKEWNKRVNP